MSQCKEVNASAVSNDKTGSVRYEEFVTRKPVNGHPTERIGQSYRLQRHQTDQSAATTTATMTPSDCQVNPSSGSTKRKVIHFSLPKRDEIKLHSTKNAWVPSRLRAKDTNESQLSNNEESQIEDVRRKFMSILNKLTPENMVLLTESIMSLPIETEKCMHEVIEILFQKAINEPSFTPQYAYICTAMDTKEVKQPTRSKTSFKKLLTKCCQDRLNEMRVHEETLAKDLRAIDECHDQGIMDELRSKYDQEEMAYRKKSVGNCRYMCELYKVGILTSQTLETSIKYLLKSPNEETLECACSILKHTGKTISHKTTFNKLKEYASAKYKNTIPTRIRFMIEDTIELKENDWVPRNARPKQVCNTVASLKSEKLLPKAVNVLSKKNTLQNQNEQVKIKPPKEIIKVVATQNDESARVTEASGPKPSLPNNAEKSNKSLVLPSVGLVTESVKQCQTSNDEDMEIEEIQKKYRSILDNITPENIEPMAKNMVSLPMKTDVCLKNVVEFLFQKTMDKPELIPQYAYICSLMKGTVVRSKDQKCSTSFKKLLITMCQNVFEAMFNRKRMVAKDRIEIESCKDKKMRMLLQSKFDQKELDYKNRSITNCRFMCELLKVNILVPPVLEMCAAHLLQCSKELSIECVCVILEHAGDAFDTSGVVEKLREFSIAHKQKLSSRIHSMVQDTLRLNNNDLLLTKSCEKLPIMEEKDEINFSQFPVNDIQELDVPPVSKDQKIKQPEINIDLKIEQMQNNPSSAQKKLNVCKTVKEVISSVTANNLNSTISELSALITNVDVMEKTVNFIFDRANVRPKSIPELVSICSSLKNIVLAKEEHTIHISMKKQIHMRCNQVLQSGVQKDSNGNGYTRKEPYTFVGELFNANVLSAQALIEFLQNIPVKLTNRGLDNTCCLLKAGGEKLEQVYNLKKILRKLTNMVSNDVEGVYSKRSSMLFKELVDLRDNKWVFQCK